MGFGKEFHYLKRNGDMKNTNEYCKNSDCKYCETSYKCKSSKNEYIQIKQIVKGE